MDRNTVSSHEVATYFAFKAQPSQWFTNVAVAAASGVGLRTARLHTSGLARVGVLDVERLFPGYRFRLAAKMTQSARAYASRLEAAAAIFGLS
jgi:hypothetical protein